MMEKSVPLQKTLDEAGLHRGKIQTNPGKDEHLDSRFFDTTASPKESLLSAVKTLRDALTDLGINDDKIYVVGGVASTRNNSEYTSDVDLYVQTQAVSEQLLPGFNRQSPLHGEHTIAYKLVNAVNGFVPKTPEEAKGAEYVDIMVSNEEPFAKWPFIDGEQHFYYEPEKNQWYGVEKPMLVLK